MVLDHTLHGPGDRRDESFVWDPSSKSSLNVQYAAFYGECEYEVRPVTSGYRVCLVYRLMVPSVDADEEPAVATNTEVLSKVASAASKLLDCKLSEAQLAYMLEHQPTQRGLEFVLLQHHDLLVAQYLASYCTKETKGKYEVYLAVVEYAPSTDPDQGWELISKPPYIPYGDALSETLKRVSHAEFKREVKGWREKFYVRAHVVPVGHFDGYSSVVEGVRTGGQGDRTEHWYSSFALVVKPVALNLRQTAAHYGMKLAARDWLELSGRDLIAHHHCYKTLSRSRRLANNRRRVPPSHEGSFG